MDEAPATGGAAVMNAVLGRSTVAVTRLGLGCASIGNLYAAIADDTAEAVVDAAWAAGIRYFDTAPHYGLGLSELRLGSALRGRPRSAYTISTKVGRRLEPDPGGAGARDREGFDVPADHRRLWDFTPDGVRRTLAGSLDRLGLDRVDVVLLHDPEEHVAEALTQAYPVLHELRAQGVVGAIGVGTRRHDVLRTFVAETDIDAVMLAGRYTLLEQPALDDLLPACVDRGVSVLNVAVFNSGLLAVDRPDGSARYDYLPVPPDKLARVHRIAEVCRRHGVALPAAALAFAGAHPAVVTVVAGAARPEEVRRNAALVVAPPPPAALWADLVAEGLLRPDAPTP
jgi:D-threo-aldose 1-dehydrogenase